MAAIILMLARMVWAQSGARKGPAKGPRALGLLELTAKGRARLIPITILYDGQFYDASAYKAAPVPMALESGTVYEAVRSGVSQGLFTVASALRGKNTWIGEGTWQSASALAAAAEKRKVRAKPAPAPVEGPPVLKRSGPEKPKPAETPPATPPASSAPDSAASTVAAPAASSGDTSTISAMGDDPDRPTLRRGAPPPARQNQPVASTAPPAGGEIEKSANSSPPGSNVLEIIPAISDSGGPDPRPYNDDLKPDEESKLRKKMLALAADEVRARAAQLRTDPVRLPAVHGSAKAPPNEKSSQPVFEDLQLRVFDLSNSNEPVLVLTARARMPGRPNPGVADLQYMVTLVARDDIYGELHKAFASTTDTQHLDALPRVELIDAVDADGDGRGELLFRQVSDAGKAFVLYRVVGDRLWPLFQGTPGQ